MATYRYFTLEDDDPLYSVKKQFRVISDSYQRILEKSQSMTKTLDGDLDVNLGGIYEAYDYTVRVRHTEPDTNYGTLADLEYFYSLNSPTASPSCKLKFVDHHGNQKTVIMTRQLQPKIVGVVLEGVTASYMVPVSLQVLPGA